MNKMKIYRQKLISKGMCINHCKRKAFSKTLCKECLEKKKNNDLNIIKKGKCPKHPSEDLINGLSRCNICVKKDKYEYQKNKKNKICVICGRQALLNIAVCKECSWKRTLKKANITNLQANKILEKQNYICPLSGRKLIKGINASPDHIIHKCKGGESNINNIRFVDREINLSRRDYNDDIFKKLCEDVFKHNKNNITKNKVALITGITGQMGSYMAEYLLNKGYSVHGLIRRSAIEEQNDRTSRINNIIDKITLHSGTLENYSILLDIIEKVNPSECYHFGAQSFVAISFEDGFSTFDTNINGTYNLLSAIKNKAPNCKFYNSASSEMFGKVHESPQNENTIFHPRSSYAISKTTGYYLTQHFREAYNIFACSGIMFNTESPRRGSEFVTRKITKGISDIKNKKTNVLILGNLDSKRDWSYAEDNIECIWKMLQQKEPNDFVIATGKTHSIKEFINLAFKYANLNYEIIDLHDLSIDDANKRVKDLMKNKEKIYVIQHPMFYRLTEVNLLLGDYSKAKSILGWEPKTKFEDLVKIMVNNDINTLP